MAALFPPWSNTAIRAALIGAVVIAVGFVGGLMIYVRTAYNTDENRAPEQPVQFDHRHHVRDDGIECLYCHPDAERSRYAGVPSVSVCMNCHSQIWNQSPLLEPVRRAYFTGEPLSWRRVHALADHVYFDHSVHVRGGIECARCHGQVEEMAWVYKVYSLQMQWCLDCHENAHSFDTSPGREIDRLTTCSACHR